MRFLFTAIILSIALSGWALSPAGDTAVYAQTYCSNQILIINGHLYGPFNTDGIEVIPGGAWDGTDSVFIVQLQFFSPSEVDYEVTICEGDTVYINGSPYHSTHYQDTEIIENGAANGCDSIVHVKVNLIAPPFSYLDDTLCLGTSIVVNGHTYNRDNRSGLEVLENASYSGCDSLVYVTLFFREAWVYIGEDQQVIQGDTVCVNVTSRYTPDQVAWTPEPPCAAPDCLSFCTGRLEAPQVYTITLTDEFGCVSTDEMRITVRDEHQVYGPNVFQPGSEAPNDRFFLSADPGVEQVLHLIVYDRWGEPVFETKEVPLNTAYSKGWDGLWNDHEVPAGVFFWHAELQNFRGQRFTRSGDVTLLR